MSTCTCGESHPHIAARRRSAEGASIVIWSDGAVTAELGYKLAGIPIARPKSQAAVDRERRVGFMFASWASVYDLEELPAWHRACLKAVRRGGDVNLAREIHRDLTRRRVSVVWQVTQTDARGMCTERQTRLPRLRWPGMGVFDRMRGPQRYEVVYIIPGTDTAKPYSGLTFATWREVEDHLLTCGVI